MPLPECDTEALQEALRRYRRAAERSQNKLAELQQYLRELNQDSATRGLDSVKKLAEFVEIAGQVTETLAKPSLGNGLETLGKLGGTVVQMLIDDTRAGNLDVNRAEHLRILQEALRLELEEEVEESEKARALFDVYWECTGRLAPKAIRFSLRQQGGISFPGTSVHSEILCTGEAELVPMDPCTDPSERLRRWLADPEMSERYLARGAPSLTVPVYDWTSGHPLLTVTKLTHQEQGGPLAFEAVVRWFRSRPASLDLLRITPSGRLDMRVRGEMTLAGQGKSFANDRDLVQLTSQTMAQHVGTAGPRLSLCAPAGPSGAWHAADALSHAWGSSLLDLTITR